MNEYMDDIEVELDEEALVEDEARAETHLRSRGYWMEKRAEKSAHANNEMEKIALWLEEETRKIDSRIAWHEAGLKAFIWRTGDKTMKLINGTLKRTKGRMSVEILDEELFLNKAPAGLIRVTQAPDKKAILDHIKLGGEIPEGSDVILSDDTFSIK